MCSIHIVLSTILIQDGGSVVSVCTYDWLCAYAGNWDMLS